MTQDNANQDMVRVVAVIAELAYENGKLEEMNKQLMHKSFGTRVATGIVIYFGVALTIGYVADSIKRHQKKVEREQMKPK